MSVKKMIRYRENWMGFAMLWIMLFHSRLNIPFKALSFLKDIGYGGVDIFLFASGIGNYYSYIRDEEALPFLKRRLARLAPVYLPFIILWCSYKVITGQLEPIYLAGNLFGIQVFSNSGLSFNWYLAVLLLCYLLTPYLASFIKTGSFRRCVMLVLALTLLSTAFLNDNKFIITATRLPIYVIGMIFAKYESCEINKPLLLSGAGLFGIGGICLVQAFRVCPQLLWPYGLYWYPFILMTPFLCIAISYLSSLAEGNAILSRGNSIICLFGRYSFELYLVHIFCFEELPQLWTAFEISYPLNNIVWVAAFFMALAGALILHIVSTRLARLARSLWKKGTRQAGAH